MEELTKWVQILNGAGSFAVLAAVVWLLMDGRLFTRAAVDQMEQSAETRTAKLAKQISQELAREVSAQTSAAVEKALMAVIGRQDSGAGLDKAVAELRAELDDIRASVKPARRRKPKSRLR